MRSSASIMICAPVTGAGDVLGSIVLVSFGFTRALKQKIWPGIPSPESEFEGLFTTHKGNFQVGGLVLGAGASLLLGHTPGL